MNRTKIEWTGGTWNTIRGCNEAGAECLNCYAKTFAERFRGVAGHPYEQGFDVRLVPGKLIEPLTMTRSQIIFVNSMSDCFHPKVPTEYLLKMGWVMRAAPWHVYQVLTKRAKRMRNMLLGDLEAGAQAQHIWWGVSVGNKKDGIPRIELLRDSKAKVKWLSVEPLLEDLGELDLNGINWVVVGGESGPGARPMKREWVESLQEQCAKASVPFFFKQWGGVKKAETGRELNGRTYSEMPPIITQPVSGSNIRQQHLAVVRGWIESTSALQ